MDKELKEIVSRLSNKEQSFYFACKSSMEYLRTKNSPQEAWDSCEDPFWMLWYLSRTWGDVGCRARQLFVRMNCDIAGMSVKFIDAESDIGKKAIAHLDSAKAWASHTEDIPTNPAMKTPVELHISAIDLSNSVFSSTATHRISQSTSVPALRSIISVARASVDFLHAAGATAQYVEHAYIKNKMSYKPEMVNLIRKHYPSPPSLNPTT